MSEWVSNVACNADIENHTTTTTTDNNNSENNIGLR